MSRSSRRARSVRGFMLLEVAISMMMLAIGAMSIYQGILSYQDMSRLAHERNKAYFDIETALENVQSTPFANIITKFPNNQNIPEFEGLHLPREHVTVHYTDPTADPLYITVTISYRDIKARTVTESLMTARTR